MKRDKQKVGEEHIVSVDGRMLGFHTIDVSTARQFYGLWDGVDAIIRDYAKVNPAEMAETLASNKMKRDKAFSDTGAGKTNVFRHTISIPMGLMLYLEEFEPTLFSNKKTLHEFMRRYKGFRTCRTV